jgi:hypothetical protein
MNVELFTRHQKRGARITLCTRVAVICTVLAMCVGTLSVPTRPVHALFGVGDTVFDPTNFIKNSISSAESLIQSEILRALSLKDLTLDKIAWDYAKKLLAESTAITIDWVNKGGENGEPLYVQNYTISYNRESDRIFAQVNAPDNYAQLCAPLQQPVQVFVDQAYRNARSFRERTQCTEDVGGIGASVEVMFKDGFQSWFRITSNPANNIYGAAVLAVGNAEAVVTQERDNFKTAAIAGNGIPGVRDCSSGTCLYTTPGSAISAQLNHKLTIPDQILIAADEIDEMIGNLFSKLTNEAMTGVSGLLGLSDSANPNGTAAVKNETVNWGTGGDIAYIDEAILSETEFLAIHKKALTDIAKVLERSASCSRASDVTDDLEGHIDDIGTTTKNSTITIAALTIARDEFRASPSAQTKIAATEAFTKLTQAGLIHYRGGALEAVRQELSEKRVDFEDRLDRRGCPNI